MLDWAIRECNKSVGKYGDISNTGYTETFVELLNGLQLIYEVDIFDY